MAQFPLKINGAEVCTLEDLKKNFNPAELIACRSRFAAWLKGWDYDEEAVAVKTLDSGMDDDAWLIAVCGIVGISEQELAAGRKKLEDAAKQEQEKAEKKQAEEQKRKIEQEQKKKLTPTPENIHVNIRSRKSPFCDAVSMVFTCEKGVLVNTESNHLYFSADGEEFVSGIPNSNSCHQFFYLNGYLLFLDRITFYFSQNGKNWDSFGIESVVPEEVLQRGSDFYLHNIVYDDNKKCFVFFYEYSVDLRIFYRCSAAKRLDGAWDDLGEFASFEFCEKRLTDFYFVRGKYFAEISNAVLRWLPKDRGVCYSDDGLHWKTAADSDREWLDGLETEENNNLIHINYSVSGKCFSLNAKEIIPWKDVYFSFGNDNTIYAWKEGYKKKKVAKKSTVPIAKLTCLGDRLLIFGKNNEFAVGEIQIQ